MATIRADCSEAMFSLTIWNTIASRYRRIMPSSSIRAVGLVDVVPGALFPRSSSATSPAPIAELIGNGDDLALPRLPGSSCLMNDV